MAHKIKTSKKDAKRFQEAKMELEPYDIMELLAEIYKRPVENIHTLKDLHEKGHGSFYIFQIDFPEVRLKPRRSLQVGVFTNDIDLTSVFEFKECAGNDKWRETLKGRAK